MKNIRNSTQARMAATPPSKSIKSLQFCLLDQTVNRTEWHEGIIYSDKPDGRSGHRCVTDGVYLYCYGGYNPIFEGRTNITMDQHDINEGLLTAYPLFRELWRYNIATRKWKLMPSRRGFPSALASHCSVMYGGEFMLVFGGTGFPFGQNNDNKLHVCKLSTAEWSVIPTSGDMITSGYGQAVCLRDSDLYIFGGTTGNVFNADLHHIDIRTGKISHLSRIEDMPEGSRKGRYRSELIFYENKLYVFGGGNVDVEMQTQEHFSFESLDVFDISNRSWRSVWCFSADNVQTGRPPQQQHQYRYPRSRKCHSCVLYKDCVYMCGGVNATQSCGDLWRLDLTIMLWTQIYTAFLPQHIYFHSAVLTHGSRMLVFGGVQQLSALAGNNAPVSSAVQRCSNVWECWLEAVPPLRELAWRHVLHLVLPRCTRTSSSTRTPHPKHPHLHPPHLTADTLREMGVPTDLVLRLQLHDT